VNFLLHRHFASMETGEPGAGFGAMLPDLARIVDRRWRPRGDLEVHAATDPGLRSVLRGIDHHLEADRWFHTLPGFKEGQRRTAAALAASGGAARRLPLFGHAAWEMLLDGAWVRRRGVDDTELDLAADAASFGPIARAAFAAHAVGDEGTPPSEAFERLFGALPALACGYSTGAGVAKRLDGLRGAVGLAREGPSELERWARALEALERVADEALGELEAAREAHLRGAVTP
jgi:hypothetical protein